MQSIRKNLNQIENMKTTQNTPIRISREDLLSKFTTPPSRQGQIVEYSYATTEYYIIERIFDRSDRSEKLHAYDWKEGATRFEPWNEIVPLGELVGDAVIAE